MNWSTLHSAGFLCLLCRPEHRCMWRSLAISRDSLDPRHSRSVPRGSRAMQQRLRIFERAGPLGFRRLAGARFSGGTIERLSHAGKYGLIAHARGVWAERNKKEIELPQFFVLHGVSPLRKMRFQRASEKEGELLHTGSLVVLRHCA